MRTVGDEGAAVSKRRPVWPLPSEREHDVVFSVKAGRRGVEPFVDDDCCGMARNGELDRGEEDV